MFNRIIAASCRDGVDLLFLNEVATIPFLARPNTIYQKEKRQFWERNDLDGSWRVGLFWKQHGSRYLVLAHSKLCNSTHLGALTRVQIPSGIYPGGE